MFFLQYILPNLISIISILIFVILGYLTYKLDKTTKTNDNKITKQKLEIENLKEQNNLIQNKITLMALEYISNTVEQTEKKEIKKAEKKLKNIVDINNDKNKKENAWFELKKFITKKKK